MNTYQLQRPVFRNIDQLFNDLFSQFPATEKTYQVPVNISEHADHYELVLLAPGRQKEEFKIKVEEGLLTISFEAAAAEKTEVKTIRKEFSLKSFSRSFSLDDKIDSGAVSARYENGLLKLALPKKSEPAKEIRQIDIQ